MTHTYAELPVSRATYDEIAAKLREAGYDHVFMPERGRDEPTIDMHGIGLIVEAIDEGSRTMALVPPAADQPLTDDMEIEIDIELLYDKIAPKVEALAFTKGSETQRITDQKATGSWNVKREYRCRFTVGTLRALARSITGGKADGGPAGDSPADAAGDSGGAGGVVNPTE
jgi:hypothetical protein